MTILALDTATEVLSVAAEREGAWATLCVRRGLQHSPALLALAQRVLADVGTGRGGPRPRGMFPGPRLLHRHPHRPCHGAGHRSRAAGSRGGSLDPGRVCRSRGHRGTGTSTRCIDARKGRYYTARYSGGTRAGSLPRHHRRRAGDRARRRAQAAPGRPRRAADPGRPGHAGRAAPVADSVDPRVSLAPRSATVYKGEERRRRPSGRCT